MMRCLFVVWVLVVVGCTNQGETKATLAAFCDTAETWTARDSGESIDKVIRSCRQLLDADLNDDERAIVSLRLGIALQKSGRQEESIEPLQRAVQLSPGNSKSHRLLGDGLSAKARALEIYAMDGQPTSSDERRALRASAIRAYRKAIALGDRSRSVFDGLGWVLWRDGDMDGAVRAYTDASNADPTDIDSAFMLGKILNLHGQYEDSVAVFERVQKADPERFGSYGSHHAMLDASRRGERASVWDEADAVDRQE
jgi:tetratricopeptide (TPR) repeat protein